MSITVTGDRTSGGGSTFTSGVSTLSITATAGDLVVAQMCFTSNNASVPVISSIATIAGQPAWTKRKQDSHHDAGGGRELFYNQEIWYFRAATNLTAQTAVVTAAGGSAQQWVWAAHTFGNVNAATPWDSNAAVPTSSVITTTTDTAGTFTGLSTTNAPGVIVHFLIDGPRAGDTHTLDAPGTGFTALGGPHNTTGGSGTIGFTRAQYKAYSSNQSNVSGSFTGTSTFIVTWGDAIREADPPPVAAIAMTLKPATQVATMNNTTFEVDGIAHNGVQPGSSFNMSLTTTKSNDVIIATVMTQNGSGGATRTASVSGGGLTWALRKRQTFNVGVLNYSCEVWWAVAATPLSSATITVSLSGSTAFATAQCYGLHGINTSTPWDTNVSLPAAATAVSTVNISTTTTKTVGIGVMFDYIGGMTPGAGYVQLAPVATDAVNVLMISEGQVFLSAQTTKAVNFNGADAFGAIIADALQLGSAPVTNSIAQTLQRATQSVTASEALSNHVAQTLARVTQSMTGRETIPTSVAQTLRVATQNATVTETLTVNSISQTLRPITQDFEGMVSATGPINQTLSGVLAQDVEVIESYPFTINQTLSGALSTEVDAALVFPATIDQTLSGALIHDFHGFTGFADVANIHQTLQAISAQSLAVTESYPFAINQVLSGVLIDEMDDTETLNLSITQVLQGRLVQDFEAVETFYVSIDQTLSGALKGLTNASQLQPAGNPAFSSWWTFGP